MSEQNEPVTVSRVNENRPVTGRIEGQENLRMRIRLASETAVGDFDPGTLIEIQSAQALYLGEVRGRQGSLMMVDVEHSIDRAALGAIENVWQAPSSE